jgi:hypothetical protein
MDRDAYTNVDTANYINQHFVAVKVDSMPPRSWRRSCSKPKPC